MMRSGGPAGQHGQARRNKAIRNALRRHGRLILASFIFLAGVIPAIALADEAPSSAPSELSLGALQEATSSPSTDDIQLTEPYAAGELPHENLGRDEAIELTEAVFEPLLESASGQFKDFEVERYLSDNTAVVSVDAQGEPGDKEMVLLESTVPLQTEDSNGDMAPVDLELQASASGAQLEPRQPLVDVRLPSQLGDGIQLPGVDVGIEIEGAPEGRSPSVIDGSIAAYPNVDVDTDFSVVPTPTGLETLTTLRSPDAPDEQTLHLDLPPGATLRQDQAGAEVVQGDKMLLRVQPPFAVDANGESVPVSLRVSGNALTISTAPGEGAAYPILVDPIIEAHDWFAANDTYGQSAWHQKVIGTNMYASSGTGLLKAVAEAGYQSSGSQAGWYYWVPRLQEEEALGRRPTSYIARMTLWHIGLQNWGSQGGSQPYLFAGIWGGEDYEHWAGPPGHEAVWSLAGNGPETWMNPGYEVKLENGEPTKRDHMAKVAWGIGIATYENVSVPVTRSGLLGAASVEVADDDSPSTANGNVTPWVNQTASVPLTAEATDSGLGVKRIEFDLPWNAPKFAVNACAGDALWPCPRTWAASLTTSQYNPAEMPEGFVYVPVGAEDVVGNKATLGATKAVVRVDHTAPALALSGSITEQAKLGTNASQYTLKYAASDGDSQAAAALTPFGGSGSTEGKTQRPIGVTTDASGNVWVVDRGNNRVEKFDETGKFLMQFGSTGSGNGQFINPNGIAISATGSLWVADGGNHRVQQFNAKGEYLQQFGIGYTPGGPEGGTVLLEPYGVATAPGGMVWVSDFTGNRVAEYRENPESGRFVRNAYGSVSNSTGNPELLKPAGLATDLQGNLWVVDSEHAKIKMFDPNGKFLTQFGAYGGTGTGQFYAPTDVDVAPSGNIFVTDDGNNRIQEFQSTGSFLRQFGSLGTANGQLSDPHGIALGANNTLFVADATNHRITRWSHADQDPQSGVGKIQVKVDGQLKATPYNLACSSNSCQNSGEWTYRASEYATGLHKVEVVAEDGVKLTTPKSVTISSVKDTVAPQLTTGATFFEAPEGWVNQTSYAYSATAKDTGYGITSLTLKIDGKAVKAAAQSCPNGGCEASLSGTLNMANYKGGAHPAELIATDGAELVAKRVWTVNVNPTGLVPPQEAAATLEAMEETNPEASPVAPTDELIGPEERADGNDPGLQQIGKVISSTGTPTPSTMTSEPGDGIVIQTEGKEVEVAPVSPPAAPPTEVVEGVARLSSESGVDSIVRPQYNGILSFQSIRQATDPETYSWEVSLYEGQSLKPVEGGEAAGVFFEDGTQMMLIRPELAHDATGRAVPTSLSVTGTNVVTLTVAHKSASYVYPVVAGAAYEVGYSTVSVISPYPPEESGGETQVEEDLVLTGHASAPHRLPTTNTDSDGASASSSRPHYDIKYVWDLCPSNLSIFGLHPGCWASQLRLEATYEYNYVYAWWKESKAHPKCPNSAHALSLSLIYCNWIGKNHQQYGGGYHITALDEITVNGFFGATFTAPEHLALYLYGNGYGHGHNTNNVCNPLSSC